MSNAPATPWPRRIGAFVAGYLVASVAASMSYTALLVASVQVIGVAQPSDFSFADDIRMLVGFTVIVAAFVVTMSFLPTVVVVGVLGIVGLRDVFSHMVGGAAVSAVSVLLASRYVPFMDEIAVDWAIVAAGAIGGAAFRAVWRAIVPRTPESPP